MQRSIDRQLQVNARCRASEVQKRELDDREKSLEERERLATVCERGLSQLESRLQERETSLDEKAASITKRDDQLDYRDSLVHDREVNVAAEEDRVESMKQDVEQGVASTDYGYGYTDDDEIIDAEDDFLNYVGEAPSLWDGRVDPESTDEHFGEVHGCTVVGHTIQEGEGYIEILEFEESALAEWTAFARIAEDDLTEAMKDVIEREGTAAVPAAEKTSRQVVLRHVVPEKCTECWTTRRILVQGVKQETEGECTIRP